MGAIYVVRMGRLPNLRDLSAAADRTEKAGEKYRKPRFVTEQQGVAVSDSGRIGMSLISD